MGKIKCDWKLSFVPIGRILKVKQKELLFMYQFSYCMMFGMQLPLGLEGPRMLCNCVVNNDCALSGSVEC